MLKNKKVKPEIQLPQSPQEPFQESEHSNKFLVPQKDEETSVTSLSQLPEVEETITEEIEYSIDDTQFTSQSPSPIYNSPIIGTVIRINTKSNTIVIEDSFHNGIELPITPLNSHNKIGEQYTEITERYSQTE